MAKSKNRTGKPNPNFPSGTGNKSGKGRGNNPPQATPREGS